MVAVTDNLSLCMGDQSLETPRPLENRLDLYISILDNTINKDPKTSQI